MSRSSTRTFSDASPAWILSKLDAQDGIARRRAVGGRALVADEHELLAGGLR